MFKRLLLLTSLIITIGACRPQQQTQQIRVSIVADGRERTFDLPSPTTVGELLSEPRVDITLGELDQINPPPFTQVTDGMRITIARVREETQCEQSDIPYRQNTALNEGLQPGEQRVVQAGQNGKVEVCYRISFVDNNPRDRVEINRTVITAPVDEIIQVGPTGEVEPVPIVGTLAYISNGNAWVMRGSSTTKQPITSNGNVDGRVFRLSSDGHRLLFTRRPSPGSTGDTLNQLAIIADITLPTEVVDLIPSNVLYADWMPGVENTISYSTGEPRDAAPGWQAFNDLYQMRIDPATGASLSLDQLVDRSTGGLYGWWGTRFEWSPDGQQVVWVQADSLGLVDLENHLLGQPLLRYPVFRTVADWSWRATVSWSPDGALFATTVHGAPVGSELPENSPAFDISVNSIDGDFGASIVKSAGIWSAPQYSPFLSIPDSEFPQAHLAYLKARDPFSSINGEYDLVVADRDGSNARAIFPGSDRPGIRAQQSILQNNEFVWSPDGRQIAIIYQGNLWVVDVASEVAHQLTLDGAASNPVWTR